MTHSRAQPGQGDRFKLAIQFEGDAGNGGALGLAHVPRMVVAIREGRMQLCGPRRRLVP